jgi:hypothetical protein
MSFYPGKIDKGDESNQDPSEKLAQPDDNCTPQGMHAREAGE